LIHGLDRDRELARDALEQLHALLPEAAALARAIADRDQRSEHAPAHHQRRDRQCCDAEVIEYRLRQGRLAAAALDPGGAAGHDALDDGWCRPATRSNVRVWRAIVLLWQ
jgi:hypothetical protein